ncbi:MAG: amino acid adenylation domain-containing protein [Acidobacteriota bacterium]|nr:amino acid adenylation domain-containing protein [Acidobacteriota bacterium]
MAKNLEDVYALSPLQEGLLFHSLYDPRSSAYFDQLIVAIQGTLDEDAFARAWQALVDRHPALRTAFAWRSGKRPLQVVARTARLDVIRHDWRGEPDALAPARLEAFLEEDRRRGFELSRPPLCRLAIIRRAEAERVIVWSRHHLLLDGWSVSLLLRELLERYGALTGGAPAPERPAPPYRDFIDWLQRQDRSAAEAFWRRTLDGFTTPTPLGLTRATGERRADPAAADVERIDRLPAGQTEAIVAGARRARVTLNTLVQGAWALLLGRLSGETDVLFGETVAGRPADLPGADAMIGLFINTLPVRVPLPAAVTAGDWLRSLQDAGTDARRYDYCPLVDVHGWSEVPRQTPLFDSLVVFENYPASTREAVMPGFTIGSAETWERTNYPLTLIVSPGTQLELRWIFDAGRFDETAMVRWMEAFRTILDQLAARLDAPLARISPLDDAERRMLLHDWNATALAFDRQVCLHQLVEAQAAATPERTAIVHRGARVSYAALNERADAIARGLAALGAGPEVPVGLCARRTPALLAGMLGILKTGAAYVPLDPAYPAERLSFMVRDAGIRLLVTERALAGRFDEVTPVLLDADAEPAAPPVRRSPDVTPENLAYVIYTSGSTGLPKGTAITHRSAVALVAWARHVFSDGELAGVLASTSVCFDLSVFEVFLTLAAGGTVVLAEHALELPSLGAAGSVTLINTVPSAIAELERQQAIPASVRTICLAGEPLTAALADRLYALPGVERVYDLYGPSEDTTYSTFTQRAPGGPATIGRPIANTQLYLVDGHLEPVPAGVIGEIVLGGDGLARGYLGRPALTAERFVPDRFSGRAGARLYRTGDLGRFRPDGRLEFLGRADHQVKIRGFRIEPGEIQARLEEHPGVADAAVVVRRDERGDPHLAAYYTSSDATAAAPGALRDYLAQRLPAYMVPDAFCRLDALPRTPNGKLDRAALPDPSGSRPASAVAPRTPTERQLVDLWQQVLGLDTVGVTDNFFDLGGHSLLATRLMARVRETLQVEPALRLVFDHPTVAELAAALDEAAATAPLDPGAQIGRRATAGPVPLSHAQQRLWFLQQLDPASAAYNIPIALTFDGPLDLDALRRALDAVAARHEVLRTRIAATDGRPSAMPDPDRGPALHVVDLRDRPATDAAAEARRVAAAESLTPFDLERDPLARVTVVRTGPEHGLLLITLHHLVGDEWSLDRLLQDAGRAYARAARGADPALPPLARQYGDFAVWQPQWLEGAAATRQREYWRQQLAGLEPLELPTDRPRPAERTTNGGTVSVEIPPSLAAALREFSRREGVTLYTTLLAVFQAFLSRYTGQTDVACGSPVAGRQHPEVAEAIGLFVNTLVLRTVVDGQRPFRELLAQVRSVALDAQARQDVPFDLVVEDLHPGRDLGRHPLFQAMFSLERPAVPQTAFAGLTLRPLEVENRTAKFDVSLTVLDAAGTLTASLQYSTDLFERETAARMLEHYLVLAGSAVQTPDAAVSNLALMTPAERRRVVEDWNGTARAFPPVPALHRLFEAQAARTPDAVAVRFEDRDLTYSTLDERANRLARHLQALGVGPDVVVGVLLDRSIEMVVALYAILKAGGAYLPLDPEYPVERLRFMVESSAAPVIITSSALAGQVPATEAALVDLDREAAVIARHDGRTLPLASSGSHLAYVIYTSGSTGRPKGVMVPHEAIVNRIQWMQAEYGLTASDRVLQKTPFSFDVSVWEFFWPLAVGAELVVARPGGHRDSRYLAEIVASAGITTLHFVPSMLDLFLQEPGLDRHCRSLRRVFASGETLMPELEARFFAQLPAELHNLYGPTEAAVDVTSWACEPGSPRASVPIGRPIANIQTHVVDGRIEPVPIGVPGELLLGGIGLARGYLDRPDLTADRFIPNPLGPAGSRLYRTGDRVRWQADGTIAYLGRIDHQVKIRGFRIELGEIEAALMQHPAVRHAVVVARDEASGHRRLVAYVVPADGTDDAGVLQRHLRTQLPEYMVPSVFVWLDAVPLTPSGKVDRRALPPPVPVRAAADEASAAPRTPAEMALAEIWRAVLVRPSIGRDDNFFELGGDSILSVQVASRARTAGLAVTPRLLFQHQTIAELASALAAQPASTTIAAGTDAPMAGPVLMTPMQHWFFAQDFAEPQHWNQAVLLEVPPDFDGARARRCLDLVVAHHDALRLHLAEPGALADGRHPTRLACAPAGGSTPFVRHDCQTADEAEWPDVLAAGVAAEQAAIDLGHGPLIRTAWFDRGPSRPGRLLMAIHHLAIDAVSWRILLDDLAYLVERDLRGERLELPARTGSPSAWSSQLSRWATGAAAAREVDYWLARGQAVTGSIPRDMDVPGDGTQGATEATVRLELDAETTARLVVETAGSHGLGIDELLLAALARTLASWSGRRSIWIDVEGQGRRLPDDADADVDLSRTVGWFTAIFPVRIDAPPDDTGAAWLAAVRDQRRAVPHQGVGFGALRWLHPADRVRERLAALPPREVVFNYLGRFETGASAGPFRPAPEPVGPTRAPGSRRPYLLEVNGGLTGGRLVLDWACSTDGHRPETLERLSASFVDALRLYAGAVAPAPDAAAAFADSGLSSRDLDRLLGRLT